jgi:hypothetical protein
MEKVMNAQDFCRYFMPFVRVHLNWKLVEEHGWPVHVSVVSNIEHFRSWYSPWYTDATGHEVDWEHPGASVISVGNVPERLTALKPDRAEKIRMLAEAYENEPQPVQLVTALYALGRSKYLVLDGNHRLAALSFGGCDARIMSVALHGPVDESVLPDLRHFL